jgi:hypothetical protein
MSVRSGQVNRIGGSGECAVDRTGTPQVDRRRAVTFESTSGVESRKGIEMEPVNRRRFLKSAGVAAGTAAVIGAPGMARAAAEGQTEVVDTPGALAREPVVVYVRDAARGEVTVMHGTRATTYRDRGLVRRLLKAARVTGSEQ